MVALCIELEPMSIMMLHKLNAEEMAYETLLILLFTSAAYSGSGVGQPAPAMQPAI